MSSRTNGVTKSQKKEILRRKSQKQSGDLDF